VAGDNPAQADEEPPEPASERRSFFTVGLHVSEALDELSGVSAASISSQSTFFTSALGTLNLLSLQRRSETALDYVGGSQFYSGYPNLLVQQLNVSQRFRWRRAVLTFADELGDYPGGSFGSEWFGGAGAYELEVGGSAANLPLPSNISDFFGASDFSAVGFGSHLTNLSLAEFAEALTPRSAITVTGGYGFTDYSIGSIGTQGLINNYEYGAQANYSYQLSWRNQVGVSYGFRNIEFPQAGEGYIQTNLIELFLVRQISSRVNLVAGAGPEFVRLSNPTTGSTNQLAGSGYASLNYRLWRTSLSAGCDRMVTSGSGLFAGADTDDCQIALSRPLRKWSFSAGLGYVRLSQLSKAQALIPDQRYQYGFASAAVQRQFGPYLSFFASYQFNDQTLNESGCLVVGRCNGSMRDHTLTVGINLVARPKRID